MTDATPYTFHGKTHVKFKTLYRVMAEQNKSKAYLKSQQTCVCAKIKDLNGCLTCIVLTSDVLPAEKYVQFQPNLWLYANKTMFYY